VESRIIGVCVGLVFWIGLEVGSETYKVGFDVGYVVGLGLGEIRNIA
jgi:hypothetical protein